MSLRPDAPFSEEMNEIGASGVNRSITQKDLAELLNISQMTVSRCLRGAPNVNARLQEKVLVAAREHGYSLEAHYVASAMQRRRAGLRQTANVICAIIADDMRETNGYHRRLLGGVCDAAAEAGSEVIVAPRMEHQFPRVVRRGQVDGVVHLPSDHLLDSGIPPCPAPWVGILFDIPGHDAALVDTDDSMRQIARHLAPFGHRHFAFIGPDTKLGRQRFAGLRLAAKECGGVLADEFAAFCPHETAFHKAEALAAGLVDRAAAMPARNRFTALVTFNDIMAMGAIKGLVGKGLSVPGDISVVGFDGTERHLPPLTTAAVPLEQLGAEAARLIAWRLEHPKAPRQKRIVKTVLVEGGTTGPVCRRGGM